MADSKIEIIQSDGRFTARRLEYGQTFVLASDKDGGAVGHQWWLNPQVFNLPEEMKTWGCNDAQIRQAIESLTSGKDTHLEFEVPR
jgi:hypothetical protein